MKCSHCGATLMPGNKTCKYCGAKVDSNTSNVNTNNINNTNIEYQDTLNNNGKINEVNHTRYNKTTSGGTGLGIASIVLALSGVPLIGLILSIIGLVKSKNTSDSTARTLCSIGLILSIMQLILYIVYFTISLRYINYPSYYSSEGDNYSSYNYYID